jgi:hypothetical protein
MPPPPFLSSTCISQFAIHNYLAEPYLHPMKRFLLLLPILAIAIISCENPSSRFPKPSSGGTIIRGHEEEENREENEQRQREKWMEQMHRTGPGVNWQAMDEASRWAKYQQYCGMAGATNKTATADTLAGGLVIGEWKERGSVNNAGRIVYAELDTTTNMIYAAADGGQVFRGNWDATGWTPLNDKLKIPGIKSVRMLPVSGGGRLQAHLDHRRRGCQLELCDRTRRRERLGMDQADDREKR